MDKVNEVLNGKVEIDKHSLFLYGGGKSYQQVPKKYWIKNETIRSVWETLSITTWRFQDENSTYTISLEDVHDKNNKVLFRAHGEPPSTYEYARKHGLEIIDATCPVVLNYRKYQSSLARSIKLT